MERLSTRRRGGAAAIVARHSISFLYFLLILSVWLLLLHLIRLRNAVVDPCSGRYIYMHDLPPRFNADILRDCRSLSKWTDMCRSLSNAGLGPPLPAAFNRPSSSWYATNQFSLDLIFHNRMKRYPCLTRDSSLASTVFVPFYAGLDIARSLWAGSNISDSDSSAQDLAHWLTSRPEWAAMGGADHFLAAGRTTWDFRRLTDAETDWGSNLFLLPAVANMTALVIESSPWHTNDMGVPYPTYFHPKADADVAGWQEIVRQRPRPWLFAFAGAPRSNRTDDIRRRLMEECRGSVRCGLLECSVDGAGMCHAPESVMELFGSSVFCLQPQGDSYTRRSAFDAMVAGCVPVFFHPGSAYVQYLWHLPRKYGEYSVFIEEREVREGRVRVEEVLMGLGEEKVKGMREEVTRLIPRLVYGDPRGRMESVKDAFDVAVEGVIERVERRRMKMRGTKLGRSKWLVNGDEEERWKFYLSGKREGEEHEWDHFFS